MSGFGAFTAHGGLENGSYDTYLNDPREQQVTSRSTTVTTTTKHTDEPVSPDAIVAYHDQLRRASVTANHMGHGRSDTVTSSTSSLKSTGESTSTPTDNGKSSRKSRKSSLSKITTSRGDRPESKLFGKFASRTSRRKHESMSTASVMSAASSESAPPRLIAGSAREQYNGRSQSGK